MAIDSDGERIEQVEAFGVLGQDRSEVAWDNVSKFPLTSQKTTSGRSNFRLPVIRHILSSVRLRTVNFTSEQL